MNDAQPLEKKSSPQHHKYSTRKEKMPMPLLPSANLTSPKPSFPLNFEPSCSAPRPQRLRFVTKCATNPGDASQSGAAELKIGSPIVIIEAPPVVKTATPMPSLRANTGQVKAGDVGRSV